MTSSAPSATAPESRNDMHVVDETAEELRADEVVAIIFSFLPCADIMRLRRVCTAWRDAAKKTLVPLTEFVVNSVRKYNVMRVMSTALPNLQQISICDLSPGHKYRDGEDRDKEGRARAANRAILGIDIISHFRMLRILEIWDAPLNGRYPLLFNFPLLQILRIFNCSYLKWDFEMLDGLPSLKELDCSINLHLTGSLSSLRVLKDTLETVRIIDCHHVEGNLMDLADFPRLKWLNLRSTNVRGDIRDISEHDFLALESLVLPMSVHGGECYKIRLISDVPSFMQAIHLLLQRRSPKMFRESYLLSTGFGWSLSGASPDFYDWNDESESPSPPFGLQFVQAGSRLGWSWCAEVQRHSCEINWLDPEPSSERSAYKAYIEELQHIERHINFYRGYYEPPTEVEYHRLCEEFLQ